MKVLQMQGFYEIMKKLEKSIIFKTNITIYWGWLIRNIATGVIADEVVNVDIFLAFGKTTVEKIEGKDVLNTV